MKTRLLKVIIGFWSISLLLFCFAMPVSSAILFYEDFEGALDFDNDWLLGQQHGSQELTTEQVRYGSKSYKFSLTRYDSGDYKQGIVPINFIGSDYHFIIGEEYWTGSSIFLPDGYPLTNQPILHHQYHGQPDQPPTCDPAEPWRNPVLRISSTNQGDWQTVNKWDSSQCQPDPPTYEGYYWQSQDAISTGEWHDFVVNVKWSYGAGGFLKVWRDGVLTTNRTGPNCFNDDDGPYAWIGIYSYNLTQDQTVTIYCDEFRIGDSTSSYSEVAPGGDTLPTITTQAVTDITTTTATGHGTIANTGGGNATKRGICWNTTGSPGPTVADSKIEEVGNFNIGAFSGNMTGLTPDQHYYSKAYGYNTAGYGYGSVYEFDAQSDANIISQSGWSLYYVDSEEVTGESGNATNSFDDNASSIWHTAWYEVSDPPCPHEIQINLGASYDIDGFRYLPRQDGNMNGRVAQYEFYTSTDGTNWGSPAANSTFVNDMLEKEVNFSSETGSYVRLKALSEVNDGNWTSMAELNVLGVPAGSGSNNPSVLYGINLRGCEMK